MIAGWELADTGIDRHDLKVSDVAGSELVNFRPRIRACVYSFIQIVHSLDCEVCRDFVHVAGVANDLLKSEAELLVA